MNLIAYLKTGPTANHPGGWRHPEADLHDIFEPTRYENLAHILENARFDAGFFADTIGLPDMHKGGYETYLGMGGQITYVDPLAVLPLMARVTTHLGLGPTLSTTFIPPYWLARTLASLDLMSKGRVCWNVVTSATEMKVRRANYNGRYVRTTGPLSMPRSPQGRPVFLQAGASDRGRDFAARWAEAIFCSPYGKQDAQAFYADIKSRLPAHGRAPDDCAVLPSIAVVLGETESIAREKADYLDSLVQTELVLATNSQMLGVDLSVHKTDAEATTAAGHQGIQGSHDRVRQVAKAENLTFAQAASRRRNLLVGTGKQVADILEDWFTDNAADGFIVWPTVFPVMLEEFGRLVVPELQRRGLLRTEYSGKTLRENLRNP
jgi:alkanesulfonate monooxygenase SsuD/methylene tetrahydromethanopterin reductase-like flavin-dependent oxidoreductase (luciferase family)